MSSVAVRCVPKAGEGIRFRIPATVHDVCVRIRARKRALLLIRFYFRQGQRGAKHSKRVQEKRQETVATHELFQAKPRQKVVEFDLQDNLPTIC